MSLTGCGVPDIMVVLKLINNNGKDMTRTGFTILLEENGITRMDDWAVSYYYNVWQDTLRHDAKVGASSDLDKFIATIKHKWVELDDAIQRI